MPGAVGEHVFCEEFSYKLHAVRSHWGVECMHWVLDMDFDKDRSAKRAKTAAANFNAPYGLNLGKLMRKPCVVRSL